MKIPKTMKVTRYILLPVAILLAVLTLMTACERSGDEPALPEQQPDHTDGGSAGNTLRVIASKQPFANKAGTRVNTDFDDPAYLTTFVDGDRIGITAVKNGAVLSDCNNVPLTYKESARTWEGNDIFYKEGATYIAYYPYRQTVMDGKKSVLEIYNAFTVAGNQSTVQLFYANDLMTSTACTANKTTKTLTITFEHRLAMLEIKPVLYGRNSSDNWEYPIKNSEFDGSALINDNTLKSFFQINADAPYRCLFKPMTVTSFEFNYKIISSKGDLKYITCTTSGSYTLTGGQRRRISLFWNRDISVGDYYYSDGSIFPGDMNITSPPGQDDGCIGVVFSVTPTQDDISKGIHGYATALSSSQPTSWNEGYYTYSLDQLQVMNNTKSVCEPNMKYAGGSGYSPPSPTSAIKPEEGVWIWSSKHSDPTPDGVILGADAMWFKGTKGTDGEIRSMKAYQNGNGKHSFVKHDIYEVR